MEKDPYLENQGWKQNLKFFQRGEKKTRLPTEEWEIDNKLINNLINQQFQMQERKQNSNFQIFQEKPSEFRNFPQSNYESNMRMKWWHF